MEQILSDAALLTISKMEVFRVQIPITTLLRRTRNEQYWQR